MEPILLKVIAWSPFLQVLVLSLGTLVSFLVAYFKNDVTIYLPFISENGAIIPEMGIFSATVIGGSFIGLVTVSYRYLVLHYLLSDANQVKLMKLNVWSWLCGIVSMFGLAGVAAFPMSTVFVVHILVAAVHFGLAMLYLWLDSFISFRMKTTNYEPPLMKTRIVMNILLTIFLVLLTICMPIGYFNWKKLHPYVLHALKTPKDEGFTMVFAGALFEWLLYVTFLSYLLTFLKEFRKFNLKLYIEPSTKDNEDIKERL